VREDVVDLGTSGFNEKLAAVDYDIRGQESAISNARERPGRPQVGQGAPGGGA